MKRQLSRFTPFSIMVYLILSALNLALASPPPLGENGAHFCGVTEWQPDNRRYARSFAANLNVGEPRTVRMIYFLPNDRPYRAEVVQRIKEMIRGVQSFFADQMQAHGYGEMTYRVETDPQGEPLVHRVDGEHPNSHYYDDADDTLDAVQSEIRRAFDLSANVYLTVIDNARRGIKFQGDTAAGVAVGLEEKSGGLALIPAGYVIDDFDWELAAHELGHTFGLHHDFRRDANVMSYYSNGFKAKRLSGCHADFLSVQPYFNPDIPMEKGVPPTIKLISPSKYSAGSEHVSVQLALNDSGGLHQAILFDRGPAFFGETPEGGGEYYHRVWGCRKLAGEKDAIVEFDYDGGRGVFLSDLNQLSIMVGAVDTDGNVKYEFFVLEVEDASEQGRVPTLEKIAGLYQQGQINTQLAQPFVVELRDQYGNLLPGEQVAFIVTAGDGRFSGQFSIEQTTTDANGRAESTFTLGPNPGNNIVLVRTPRLSACLPVRFNAVAVGVPTVSVMDGDYRTWHLPDGAIRRFGKGRLNPSDRAVDISADGQRLAVASGIGVWIYDVATSSELALLPTTSAVYAVSFSPDETTLASGLADGRIKLWDVAAGTNIATLSDLELRPFGISSVVFSRDGKTLASGSRTQEIDLWDVETGFHLATLEENPARSKFLRHIPVSFSPDGSILASGSYDGDSTVKLWDVATRTWIATLTDHERWVESVAFSRDGRILASGAGDGVVILWDVATKENIASLKHRAAVGSVAFSPDESTLAVGLPFGQIKLWDLATETNIATFEGQVSWTTSLSSVSFSLDGRILAAAAGETVSLWDVEKGNAKTLYGHNNVGNSMSFSWDGTTLASGSWDGTVKLWDVETGRNIYSFFGLHVPHDSSYAPSVVSFSPDERTLAAGFYGKVMLWDVATRTHITTFNNLFDGPMASMSFSPDGATLFRGHSEKIVQMDVATGTRITTDPLEPALRSMALSPDGTILASGARLGTVRLWDASNLTLITTLEEDRFDGGVGAVAFSRDGRTLASGSYRGIKLWDVLTQRHIATLAEDRFDGGVRALVFSRDGRTLASGTGNGGVVLWDVQTRQIITTLDGHTGTVVSVVFSRDGTTLATGSSRHLGDSTLLLWDMTELEQSRLPLDETIMPDPNLRAAIATAVGMPSGAPILRGNLDTLTEIHAPNASISDLTGLEVVAPLLEELDLSRNSILDISAIAGLTQLISLNLWGNSISDISAVAGLTNLTELRLGGNSISDILPLLENTGLGREDEVHIQENPLNYPSIYTHIPTLQERGVIVNFDNRTPQRPRVISGDNQQGIPGTALEKPYVVEIQHQKGAAFEGVPVIFTITAGGGTLSKQTTTTDSNGRAESILTLGPNPGTNTVTVSVTGSQETRTFNAEGFRIPKTLEIISGVDQKGLPGNVLEKPFVVEVRDQTDNPLPGVEVTFTVTAGGGTVQPEIATTDENGRAESILTLGPNPATNTVEATVTGIEEKRTFTAEGSRIPKTLEIISGVDQAGLPGDALEKPFVVEVRDQTDTPLPGVEVTFTVTAGGGTVQPEIATTDENGRAESTLTLGSTPGTNTVRVSVEGNTQAVALLTIETVRVFALSIPAGTHAIHIPLAVNQINGEDATIETVGDLYNALGDAVNFIITVGDDGGWKTYLGDISTGTVADAEIEDDTGLIVVMSDAKTLELVGDALGTDSASMISIDVGNNLVGVPLEPDDMSMISDLLVDGVGAIAVSKADGMGFHTIREPGQDGDAPIVGGVGYLVVYIGMEATSIPIVGSAWENSGAVSAAPAVAFDGTQTPVLYVEGGVMDEFNMLARASELRVTVKNLSTGASLDTVLGTELSATAYSGTFVELSRHAAKAGDVLEIVARSPNPFVGVRPVPQIVVSAEQVLTSRISLPDLELYEIPSETELLANYPNPFNPETWIPYRLAKAAEVTLEIYDAAGGLVRTIDVGFKPAAVYESRASAIYWDGRNNQGESVASGLYFYQLGTPSFRQIRRMVILK